MLIGSSLRNQKQQKRHKIHVENILQEMKGKNTIEDLDQRDLNPDDLANIPFNKSHVRQSSKNKIQLQSEQKTQKRRAKLSQKLEEIVQYAKVFPSQRKSSNFNSLQQLYKKQTLSKFHRRKALFQQKKKPNFNKSLLLDFEFDHNSIPTINQTDVQKAKEFSQKVKDFITQKKQQLHDTKKFTMQNFIIGQAEIQTKHKRHRKNSSQKKVLDKLSREKKVSTGIDIRDEKLKDFHKFIRGGEERDFGEFSDFISFHEIERNREDFRIYDRIYRKIQTTVEKVNPAILQEQTVRNVFYLNEAMKAETKIEKKNQLKKAMKRLKLTP